MLQGLIVDLFEEFMQWLKWKGNVIVTMNPA